MGAVIGNGMEIHPPVNSIQSPREFFVHLSMITIGILIALGLEQSVEAWHRHELGVQARENILSELRDNQRELDQERNLAARNKARLEHTLDVLRQLQAHKKLTESTLSINMSGADLSSTSWTTAATTGAIACMGYSQAKRFAKAYEGQTLLQRVQEEGIHMAAQTMATVAYSANGPDHLSDEQLRNCERQVENCLAQLDIWSQIASQLSDEYARVLKGQ